MFLGLASPFLRIRLGSSGNYVSIAFRLIIKDCVLVHVVQDYGCVLLGSFSISTEPETFNSTFNGREKRFRPEMRLKSQIINKSSSLSVTLPAHDRSLNIFFFVVLRFLLLSRVFGLSSKRVHDHERRKKFLVNFLCVLNAKSQQKRKEEEKYLLQFNADQNTQKVFPFVGVYKWCHFRLSKNTLKRLDMWHVTVTVETRYFILFISFLNIHN